MSQIELIQKKIRELDAGSLDEVSRFIDDLLEKNNVHAKDNWVYSKQAWAGVLEDMRNEYTSIELQKKALDWWNEDVSR